ncbi:hypothetical protein HMPREF0321_1232 [Dermacoccus sp. Ellin185]|nr:hypothetical protein HMPREF0321_1232 [Dermacoccus sp. Ellin185]
MQDECHVTDSRRCLRQPRDSGVLASHRRHRTCRQEPMNATAAGAGLQPRRTPVGDRGRQAPHSICERAAA